MVIEHYISDLLYRYNCVTIPNFGAFLAHQVSAHINTDTNTFFAPSKSLAFNVQLTSNDGLLVSYMAETEKISYEYALGKLEEVIAIWKTTLESGEKLSLVNIGELWINQDDKIQFQPGQKVNYLTSSFGFSTFNTVPITREILKEEVVALEEKIPFVISPERRENRGFRPYLKYAAIFLLALSTGLTGYHFYKNGIVTEQLVRQEAQEQIAKEIQEATFFDIAPVELPVVNIDATVISKNNDLSGMHHIVAGAFRIKANADRKITQLRRLGYDAAYYGTNAYGLHMVTYDRHTDPKEALKSLREIKRTQSPDAWLHSEK
ncbi:SPOR domain-containing protein [Maribacter sp. 2304DJ31-5]|uniref:HU domain-containing protein n=1 Tax=Maribacter sp. 2304DJ31-5 TaxID=3386273 RepID=UPI0039BD016E